MSLVLLKYQDNFADNLTELAWSRIVEDNSNNKCFFENDTIQRKKLENKMSFFDLDIRYLSKNQVKTLTDKSYNLSRKIENYTNITKELIKISKKDKIMSIAHFKIDNIPLITENIKNSFKFNDTDFITNYDILDEILSVNSIGLYINKKDISDINYQFIYNSAQRLNKYLKKPVLYIFSDKCRRADLGDLPLKTKLINILDWKEEFYLLTKCKNKIILSNKNSYSEGFWATILNDKNYLTAFDKKLKPKITPDNWIAV